MQEMNPIEPIARTEDTLVIIEEASDFGKGIGEAFVRLAEKLNTQGQKRECYGIVTKKQEGMTYYAAFTELYSSEAEQKSLPTFLIPKGNYQSIRIDHWNEKILQIGPTFDQILKSGKVDTLSPCVEYYRTEQELICMVKDLD